MNVNLEKVKDRIRKLLNLAADDAQADADRRFSLRRMRFDEASVANCAMVETIGKFQQYRTRGCALTALRNVD
jgi:hypothetical protein